MVKPSATASDPKDDLLRDAGDDPNRDIVATSYTYDDSGRMHVSVTMAAPIDTARAPLSFGAFFAVAGANGLCEEDDDDQLWVFFDTGPNRKPTQLTRRNEAPEDLAPPSVQIDGARAGRSSSSTPGPGSRTATRPSPPSRRSP